MTTGSAILDMIRAGFMSTPSSGLQKKPIPLVEMVRSAIVMISREVVQLGMISKIHISAAKTKSAITRC